MNLSGMKKRLSTLPSRQNQHFNEFNVLNIDFVHFSKLGKKHVFQVETWMHKKEFRAEFHGDLIFDDFLSKYRLFGIFFCIF